MTSPDDRAWMLRSSRYNFAVPIAGGVILYNAATGTAVNLAGDDALVVAGVLTDRPRVVDCSLLPSSLIPRLRRGGFLLEESVNELAVVREHYWRARGQTPMVLTLTVTQDCNLGCYYCYESRSEDALASRDIESIIDWTRRRVVDNRRDSIHVDWYGGEPLLNLSFIETASQALQELCADLGVSYSASIISNGTHWPEDPADFIRRRAIRQVQISFDGLKANHDKRRRYRKGRAPSDKASSFDQAVALVDRLLDVTRVDVRFNVDRGNESDAEGFVAFCQQRGWFDRAYPCVFQLARISDYSERSGFVRRSITSEHEFEEVRDRVRRVVPAEATLDETTSRATYPMPRRSVCAALAHDSVVIGADGHHYRCGLQVGEKGRAVHRRAADGQMVPEADLGWWDSFDPTEQPNCRRCSFLPVCWGGCPKKHLEGDSTSLAEQSLYWRTALPQKIAWQFGVALDATQFAFTEQDQFRGE
jgi:uncharacterized protein